MTVASSQPRGAHLVGSVPLDSAEAVFRAVAPVLGGHLRRVPDGETRERATYVGWQVPVFARQDAFEQGPPAPDDYPPVPRFKLRAGADSRALDFGPLGYAAAALDSYATFAALKREGVVPSHCRFQVSIATPLDAMLGLLERSSRSAVEPVYEAALLADVDRMLAGIPHDQLAIQWDVCHEVWLWEGWVPTYFPDVQQAIVERLAGISARVPEAVELGYHLCYGDHRHQHFHEPRDLGTLVAIANGVTSTVTRPIQWIHMPVPIERDDAAYFVPLRDLTLHPETELYLGLVHMRDGEAGTRRRIAAAQQVRPQFGVATECGLGRRPPERGGAPETLHQLLQLHAAVAAPVTGQAPA
jgi:hypothetical protein